jgi:glycosyltransferase involved in cell wall biosynthesis
VKILPEKEKLRKLLCLIRSDYSITQRPIEVLDLLRKEEAFDQIVCVSPHPWLSKAQITGNRHVMKVELPLFVPDFSFLRQKGLSLSLFMWLQAIIRLKIMFRRTKFDVCWTGDLLPASMGGLLKTVGLCSKIVYDDPDYYPVCYSGLIKFLAEILESMAIKNANLVISVSPEIAKIREQQGAKFVCSIPHGVDYTFFGKAYKERLKRITDPGFKPKVLLFAGNFTDELRNDLVLNSLKKLHETRKDFLLLLVGTGDQSILNKFFQESRKMGFKDCVKYLGIVSRSSMPHIYALADIGLCKLTAPYLLYGTTKKIIEYMASGLPVVVSSIGPSSILVQKSRAGFVALPQPIELAEAIDCALKLSKNEYLKMSRNAREYVRQYDWRLLGENYRELVRSLA